jgi:hypothetical protein
MFMTRRVFVDSGGPLKPMRRLAISIAAAIGMLSAPIPADAGSEVRSKVRVITGIFSSMEGGTGSGGFGIFDGRRVVDIAYENPREEHGFEDGRGFQIGAIWRVRYTVEPVPPDEAEYSREKTMNVLRSMTFTGHFDRAIKAADELIHRHYALLAKGDYRGAYEDLSPSFRARQSYEAFVSGFRGVRFTEFVSGQVGPNLFAQYGLPGYATSLEARSPRKAVFDVVMSKFVDNDYKHYRFTLVRAGSTWKIDRVTLEDR